MNHWGLKHWLLGFKEYIWDRCLCCARYLDTNDEERAWRTQPLGFSPLSNSSSDCFCVNTDDPCMTNNPVGACACLPFALVGHLCCLPMMCCFDNKTKWDNFNSLETKHSRDTDYNYYQGTKLAYVLRPTLDPSYTSPAFTYQLSLVNANGQPY